MAAVSQDNGCIIHRSSGFAELYIGMRSILRSAGSQHRRLDGLGMLHTSLGVKKGHPQPHHWGQIVLRMSER